MLQLVRLTWLFRVRRPASTGCPSPGLPVSAVSWSVSEYCLASHYWARRLFEVLLPREDGSIETIHSGCFFELQEMLIPATFWRVEAVAGVVV